MMDSSSPEGSIFPFGTALDDSQRTFCTIEDGAVRLLAPAGSGKTHSLLWRCWALAERSKDAKLRFLIFTFTRAAREELRDRLKSDRYFEDLAASTTVSTLNSWGFKLVKAVTKNLRLITSNKDRYFCIQNVLQPIWCNYPEIKVLLEDSRRRNKAGKDLLEAIDFLKTMGFRHDQLDSLECFREHLMYLKDCGMEFLLIGFLQRLLDMEIIADGSRAGSEAYERFVPFWRDACEHLFNSALISLDDQKYWAWLELEKLIESGRYTTGYGRYHHILVDEFQDINPLDLALLKAVATVNKAKLTIVGDDDQAIYEWRGATPEFVLEPETHIGGTYKTCILAVNYRSPRNIVELSQKLIANNSRRVAKDVKAHGTTEANVEVHRYRSIEESISGTVELVHSLLDDPQCKRVALIGRKRSQIIPYQIVFASQQMPFYAAEDLQVFLSDAFRELKDILAIQARSRQVGILGDDPVQSLLKLCDRVKRYPLAKRDREALQRFLYSNAPKSLQEATGALARYTGTLKGSNTGGRMSMNFAMAINSLVPAQTVSEAIQSVSENFDGLQKDYGKSLEDIFYADPPFLYLSEYAKRYGDNFQQFYSDVERAMATLARVPPESDDDFSNDEPGWKLPLHLMTALRAKGKEFDAVIILDSNDGVWPSKLAETDNQLEQERRLFYVAMTRARRHLFFVMSDDILGESLPPTPYLKEMGIAIPPKPSSP